MKYFQSTLDKAMQDAEQAFLEQAAKETLTGRGEASFTERSGLLGMVETPHRTSQTASLNVGDFLKGLIEAQQGGGAVQGWGGGLKLPTLGESEVPGVTGIGSWLDRSLGTVNTFQPLLNTPAQILDSALRTVGIIQGGDTSGDWARITQEAQAAAQADVKSKLEEYLKRQGFGRRIIIEPEKPEQIASMAPKPTSKVTGSLKG